jgi:hypothetical protein
MAANEGIKTLSGKVLMVPAQVIPVRRPVASQNPNFPFAVAPYRPGYWADKAKQFGETLQQDLPSISIADPDLVHDRLAIEETVDAIRQADPAKAGYTIVTSNPFVVIAEGIKQNVGNAVDAIGNKAKEVVNDTVSDKTRTWIWFGIAAVLIIGAFAILASRRGK